MLPASTCWPPKRLTPRRCAFDSRLFLEDDWPFLCATVCSLSLDAGHANARELVAVAAPLAILAPAFELEDAKLHAAVVIHHFGREACTLHVGLADGDLVAVREHENLI